MFEFLSDDFKENLAKSLLNEVIKEMGNKMVKGTYSHFCVKFAEKHFSKLSARAQVEFLEQFKEYAMNELDEERIKHRKECSKPNCELEKVMNKVEDMITGFCNKKVFHLQNLKD